MSCYAIKMEEGHKVALPIASEDEFRRWREGARHLENLRVVRESADPARVRKAKSLLVQMNYSLGTPEGLKDDEAFPLKGAKTVGNSVGMDIDHLDTNLQETIAKVLAKKDELGLLMMERSARCAGLHVVFKRHPKLSNEENLRWASDLLGVEFDSGAKDITRVFFSTSNSAEDLLFLSEELFDQGLRTKDEGLETKDEDVDVRADSVCSSTSEPAASYLGIPYSEIIAKWWQLYNDGHEPVKSNRDVLTFELAVNLRHICGFDRELMDKVIPCYDGFPEAQKLKCIDSALAEKRTQMPKRLKDVLAALRAEALNGDNGKEVVNALDGAMQEDALFYTNRLSRMPLGVRESLEAVEPALALPMIATVCPIIGTLATGVELDVHGVKRNLNLITYIAGDCASNKGAIDPVLYAWTDEMKRLDKMYQMQEEEWRRKKVAAKNAKEQPEEPKLPVRMLTLNNTVANLAERLANTEGRHAFSFTPEADTVAQRWRSVMSDFSVMLRQSYDGSSYEREARSAEAVNVHIEKLLWNVVMCGTPDALYRVVSNYTDGFQSRIAVMRTPDNTFSPLEEKPYVLTELQQEHIQQVAHLLPLMVGDIVLPKLETKGREWLEEIRLETMKNDDKVRARQRFRVCVTAQRMTCCLMLCQVCEMLIKEHGYNGAEKLLKQNPHLWQEKIVKTQTQKMLNNFEVIADALIDNALFFFRDRIEAAFHSRDYAGNTTEGRSRRGKNDSIYERLDVQFTFEQALQQSIAIKGCGVTQNRVQQMLKNWKNQGLVIITPEKRYCKISH